MLRMLLTQHRTLCFIQKWPRREKRTSQRTETKVMNKNRLKNPFPRGWTRLTFLAPTVWVPAKRSAALQNSSGPVTRAASHFLAGVLINDPLPYCPLHLGVWSSENQSLKLISVQIKSSTHGAPSGPNVHLRS